ncbi:restriction endonuclease subunit S [Amphibiibacter pelophylacis]|uniref:Restriction endonuclease subunit S n=1 Tax=Amphibiibacter pelophylacis TaxID=1799477 RepID=A0ACC6P5V1_9BURK
MELLEQHFDMAFSAPDGVPRLRELILKLAMQGKLVPQDANESPASELLRSIEAEKKRLMKERKIKAPKTLPEITASDEPYSLPYGWQWVRLGAIGNIFNGNSINSSEKESKYEGVEGLPYIATKDVGYGFDPLDYDNGICIPLNEEKFRVAHQGAVLICAEGGSAGKKCGLTDRDICFGNKLFATEVYGQIPSRFVLYVYLSPAFRASFTAAMTGIIGGVSIAKFVEILIPLPPLNEQHRIVAKVDKLMAQCDALENLRKERENKRLAIHTAALSQLIDTTGNSSADDAWAFITQHFGDLYSVKENVSELRKAILQLAVVGKLVPQDPNDQPTSDLLKEIAEKKQQLVKNKLLKIGQNTEDTKFICHDVVIPKTWKWVKGSEILFVTKLAGFEFTKYIHLQDEGEVPVIRAQNVRQFHVDLRNLKFIDLKTSQILDRCALTKPSLLVTFIGAGIGDVALFDLPERWHLAPNVAKMEPFVGCEKGLNLRYLNYFLLSPLGRREIFKHLKSTAQPSISMGTIRDIDYPLPPVAEQHRIVEKIDRLMTMCDTLEQTIGAALWKKTEMLDAMMAQV